jgi:TonB family protein
MIIGEGWPSGPSRFAPILSPGLLILALLGACGGGDDLEGPTPLYGEVPIEYPLDLWDADVEGQTTLRVRVTEMGVVDSVEVVEASGYPAFDSAAVRGARQLRYSPARRGGERITVWARVPVHFTKDG